MEDELPMNYCTPAIAEYDGTTDPMEHLSRFEKAALLHRYTDRIKCRVFITTFARAAQQWFNQLPAGAIGSFQEFRPLFVHQFASSRKLRKIELSLFVVRQKDNEPLKEYLQRFNAAALEVPSAMQEVGTSSSPWPRSRSPSLSSASINMEDAQAAKKESRREKRKETKEEVPSKKGQPPTPQKARGIGPYQKQEGDKAKETKASSLERFPKEGTKYASGSKGEISDPPEKGSYA
ncbi:UNVERIFIED_CONTAM: hypothetical protein Slati_3067300 [Sesamum latifolium]|uniref:Retrotransposon gag domain-containing protein n=1 Tax=Sesamum latifolium TaxID=2727402 RepID=A0AAW2UT96_9LAMI